MVHYKQKGRRYQVLLPFFIGIFFLITACVKSAGDPCQPFINVVLVNSLEGNLFLCGDGGTVKHYPVSIGRKGPGKKKKGDKKTPLGTYSLGSPRKSENYIMFIPVGYPTERQLSEGYTGSNIGIHGPREGLAWLGRLNSWVDWTLGCIAVGREKDIQEISDWIRENNTNTIHIR